MKNLQILDLSYNLSIKNLKLIELYVAGCSNITDVSWMTSLQILHASDKSGINNKGIKNLKLIQLDVSWMITLQILHTTDN